MIPSHRHAFIVGAQRSGSTWLYQLLSRHHLVHGVNLPGREPRWLFQSHGHTEYDSLIPKSAGDVFVTLEKSVAYLEIPEMAERAYKVSPTATVIVILRDPVERAYSNWKFSTQNKFENLPFSSCLSKEAEERPWQRATTSPFKYVSRGFYWRQLVPWMERFPRLHVVQFEKLRCTAEHRTEIHKILEALALDSAIDDEHLSVKFNSSHDETSVPSAARDILSKIYSSENQKLTPLGIDLQLWS